MTVALIEAPGGPVELQAMACFQRLRDLIKGTGRRIDSVSFLVVEVSRRENLAAVMRARSAVFGDRKPRAVSNRLSLLPANELIRLTVELEQPTRLRHARRQRPGCSAASRDESSRQLNGTISYSAEASP